MRVCKTENLGKIGKGQRPLTEIEQELERVKRELALANMERDILKNHLEGAFNLAAYAFSH